jgi:hypothetical protein
MKEAPAEFSTEEESSGEEDKKRIASGQIYCKIKTYFYPFSLIDLI